VYMADNTCLFAFSRWQKIVII